MQITTEIANKVLSIVDAGLVKGVGNPKAGEMCVEAAVCFALDLPHGDDPQCVSRALRQLKINLNDRNWSSKFARAKGLRRLAVAQLGSRDHLNDKEFARRVAELAIRKSVPEALRAAASIHKDPIHAQALRDAANKCECEPTKKNSQAARKTAYAADAAANAANAANAAANAAYAADAAADAANAANAAANAADAADTDAADAYAYASDTDAADAAANAANAAYAAANAANAAYAANAAANADANAAANAYAANARDKSLADFAESVVQILIEMKAPGVQWLALTEVV